MKIVYSVLRIQTQNLQKNVGIKDDARNMI